MPLTAEQQAVADAYTTGQNLIVQAGAGSGKTSTLVAAAQAAPGKRTAYIAFNRAVAEEAGAKFPRHVKTATANSLAYAAVGKFYKDRLGGKRVPSERTAKILGTKGIDLDDIGLDHVSVAQRAMEMVMRFCYSADNRIHPGHLPFIPGLEEPEVRREVAQHLLPYAEKAWGELQQRHGNLDFSHNHYMKMWQLSGPTLPFDAIMLDEAQDTNPALADVINNHFGGQRVVVGDAQQALYAWRGAVDSMAMMKMGGTNELYLTQSFRFGDHIADEANVWLELLNADLRLRGTPSLNSQVGEFDDMPDAVLCRTNAGAIVNLMRYQDEEIPVAIVGAGPAARAMAQAARALLNNKRPESGELSMFGSWPQVCRYVREDSAGSDLATFVGLVNDHGPEAIIDAVNRSVSEKRARVTVTTAHRGKGREWGRVRIHDDWLGVLPKELRDQPGMPAAVPQEDLRACYVAVTRAKHQLDLGSLQQVKEQALANTLAAV